jgi:hypothetical protein
VRSTPARLLHKDQLLVDRYAVHKITNVQYPLPQNTVTVHLKDQMTGEESTRDFRWDQHLSTEEPLEVKMRRCHSEGSKRNFRIWGDALLEDCSSTAPNKRGGPARRFTSGSTTAGQG